MRDSPLPQTEEQRIEQDRTTGKGRLTTILILTKELKPVPETKQEMEFQIEQMTDLRRK